ncbi:MAG: CHAP domain-containing protein [Synergistaceae bacterium]|jgi:hypothetical protein|nr:CHAP domain-containing protein [Synergistaceae bacterium]
MPKILAITEAMHNNARSILTKAGEIQASHGEMTRIAGGMTPYFNGTLPELLTQRLLDMKKKHEALYEKIEQYSEKIDYAADNYDWSDKEIAGWAEQLSLGLGTLMGGVVGEGEALPIQPGAEIREGYQVPLDSAYYNNSFARGQCTWYAFGRSQELTGKSIQWNKSSGRDAKNWPTAATNLAQNDIPSTGNVIVYGANQGGAGSAGHVAVVEEVEPIYQDGKIVDYRVLLSDANWDDGKPDGTVRVDTLSKMKNNGITFWGIV